MTVAVKPDSVSKTEKKKNKQNDLSLLAKAIISNAGVGIYIVQHGKFVYVSELYQKLSGYTDTELIGTYSLNNIYPDDREMVREEAIKCLKGERFDPYEYRFVKKNNEVMWILETITPIVYKGERASLGSFMDITKRRKMEETIRQSEERYRTILDEMEDAYFEVDLAGNYTFVNDAGCRHLGYSREELIGATFRGQMAKEEIDIVYNAFNKIFRTGKPVKVISYKVVRKDGTTGFTEMTGFPLKNQQGEVIGFRGVGHDITERKQMEEYLRQSEEKYRAIIENIQDGYFEVDLAGNCTFFNESLREIYGYPKEELMGMNFQQYADKENAKKVFNAFNEIYQTGITGSIFEYEIIRKDGTRGQVEVSASLIKDSSGKPIGFRGTTRDVTERRKMEETIRQSEEKYRTILDEMEDAYFEVDLAGNITFLNDAICRLLRYPKEELLGESFRVHVNKDDLHIVYNAFGRIYSTGKPERDLCYKAVRKDGTTGFAEMTGFPLRNQKGEMIGFRGIGREVTERMKMEENLRQSEEKYRTILTDMQEGYFEVDLAGNFTFCNDSMS